MPHPILSGYVLVENGRLFYEIAGGGSPIVFLHGFTVDHRMWDAQWDFFRSQRMVIRYDQRGHGRSTDPVVGAPWSDADDLMLLLAHLGVERAHLCGLSAGGSVALDFAVTYPAAVRSLTLIGSSIGGFRGWTPEMRDFFALLPLTAKASGVEAARELWLRGEMLQPAFEQPGLETNLRRMIGDYRGWHWLNDGREIVPDPLPYDRLEEIRAPTLVIRGERDVEDFRNMTEALAERIRGARREVIAGVGHMASMEAPNTVNRLISEFLREVEGASPRF